MNFLDELIEYCEKYDYLINIGIRKSSSLEIRESTVSYLSGTIIYSVRLSKASIYELAENALRTLQDLKVFRHGD